MDPVTGPGRAGLAATGAGGAGAAAGGGATAGATEAEVAVPGVPGGATAGGSGRRHPLGHLGPIRGHQTPGVSRPVDISPSGQGSQGETHHQQTHQADPGEDEVFDPESQMPAGLFAFFPPTCLHFTPPGLFLLETW